MAQERRYMGDEAARGEREVDVSKRPKWQREGG